MYYSRTLSSGDAVDLPLSTVAYVFFADTVYFNGIKIIIGATNTFKVVDIIQTQLNWDSVFNFETQEGSLRVTNLTSHSIRLRYLLIQQ